MPTLPASLLSRALACAFLALGCRPALAADQAATPPPPLTFGFHEVACLSGSDTLVSPALHRKPVHRGRVASAGKGGSLVLEHDPLAAPGSLARTHYALFLSGPLAGAFYTVASNQGPALRLDLNGDTLDALQAGDTLSLIPYWTLDSLFPPDTQSIHPSPGRQPGQIATRILLPDLASEGIDLQPGRSFFLSPDGWLEETASNRPVGGTLIRPDMFFWIRHRPEDPGTVFSVAGYVHCGQVRLQVDTLPDAKQDNALAIPRPVDVKVSDLGLLEQPGIFTPSSGPSVLQRKDLLLVFDNAAAGIQKAPAAIYYYDAAANHWRNAAAANAVADDAIVPAGTGLILRKAAGDGSTRFWIYQCPP